jgi:hypothetical protein
MEQSVPKRRHIQFRHQGIAQKKTYNKNVLDSETGGTDSLYGEVDLKEIMDLS